MRTKELKQFILSSFGSREFYGYEVHKALGIQEIKIGTSRLYRIRDEMKEEGAKAWADTLQPRRGGDPSKEFIQHYPEESKKLFTKKEIATAKNVWYTEKGAKSWSKDS